MTGFKSIIAAIALNVPALAAAAATPQPAQLEVDFTGIQEPTGAIMLAIFDSEAGYNSEKPVRGMRLVVGAAAAKTLIEGLPAGRYAIKSFHDVDGDGKMATNPYGMPVEPFAFSNNAKGNMGPASWAQAAFEVKAGANTHAITIQ